ncbi:MAG: cupin domain-containing protein [bacterium]
MGTSTAPLLAITLLFASATASAQTRSSGDARDIRAARIAQNAAMAAGDVERTAQWWTEDVTIRRGLGAGLSGIESYKAIIERAPLSDTALVYWRTTTDVNVSPAWPLAYETGTWTARVAGKGPSLITGRYSAQWVKRNERWLIRSEVFVALSCTGKGCQSKALVEPAVVATTQTSAIPLLLHSMVFPKDSGRTRSLASNQRSLVDTATAILAKLEMHESTLKPGMNSHPPHRHAHEEVIYLEQGDVSVFQENVVRKAHAGDVIFLASNQWHNFTNIGTTDAKYLVVRIDSRDEPKDLPSTNPPAVPTP